MDIGELLTPGKVLKFQLYFDNMLEAIATICFWHNSKKSVYLTTKTLPAVDIELKLKQISISQKSSTILRHKINNYVENFQKN